MCFLTTLAYVALRLLGLPADDPMLAKARSWLQGQPGGVKGIPTWGKFWLAILGLYEYRGLNAIPPGIVPLTGVPAVFTRVVSTAIPG